MAQVATASVLFLAGLWRDFAAPQMRRKNAWRILDSLIALVMFALAYGMAQEAGSGAGLLIRPRLSAIFAGYFYGQPCQPLFLAQASSRSSSGMLICTWKQTSPSSSS